MHDCLFVRKDEVREVHLVDIHPQQERILSAILETKDFSA